MPEHILKYLTAHPNYNAISCATILGFLFNLDLNQIANTIVLSIIGALSGYMATKILERCLKWKRSKK
ncbi:MAG TPA: hypothetical protein VK590_15785 [Saprospiraceae bacterium]|nr:hypothetical protein [Saprospiraceae bacterium]